MDPSTVVFAFSLTLLAGLSTGLGGAFIFFTKRTNTKLLSFALGFSAGVMIYVSFVELFFQANVTLTQSLGSRLGSWITVLAFFGGICIIAIIDRLIPSFENIHEIHKIEEIGNKKKAANFQKLHRIGLVTAVAIAIHNFPEGIATFTSALTDVHVGILIGLAIAIHNIPEGIAVAIPLFYSTGNKLKSFFYSLLSGLAEPLGALIGYLVLLPFLNEVVFGVLFASIAGIMVFISLDELLPAAREYGESHLAIYGLIGGMMIMAISLLLFL